MVATATDDDIVATLIAQYQKVTGELGLTKHVSTDEDEPLKKLIDIANETTGRTTKILHGLASAVKAAKSPRRKSKQKRPSKPIVTPADVLVDVVPTVDDDDLDDDDEEFSEEDEDDDEEEEVQTAPLPPVWELLEPQRPATVSKPEQRRPSRIARDLEAMLLRRETDPQPLRSRRHVRDLSWLRRQMAGLADGLFTHRVLSKEHWPELPDVGRDVPEDVVPAIGWIPSRSPLSFDMRRAVAAGWRMGSEKMKRVPDGLAKYVLCGVCCVDDGAWLRETLALRRGGGRGELDTLLLEIFATVHREQQREDPLALLLGDVLGSSAPSPNLAFFALVVAGLVSKRGDLCTTTKGQPKRSQEPSFAQSTASAARRSTNQQRSQLPPDSTAEGSLAVALRLVSRRRKLETYAVASGVGDQAEHAHYLTLRRGLHVVQWLTKATPTAMLAALETIEPPTPAPKPHSAPIVLGRRHTIDVDLKCATALPTRFDVPRRSSTTTVKPPDNIRSTNDKSPETGPKEDDSSEDDDDDDESQDSLTSLLREFLAIPMVELTPSSTTAVGLDEFGRFCLRHHGRQVRRIRRAHVATVLFDAADTEKVGHLDLEQFGVAFRVFRPESDDGEIRRIYEQALYDHRALDYATFYHVMRKDISALVRSEDNLDAFLSTHAVPDVNHLPQLVSVSDPITDTFPSLAVFQGTVDDDESALGRISEGD